MPSSSISAGPRTSAVKWSCSSASACACSASVVGVQLVRRHVREIARAVRSLREERGLLGGVAQLRRLEVAEHDPLDLARLLLDVLRLPAAGRVAADDRPLDERPRLVGERQRQALVEQPAERRRRRG